MSLIELLDIPHKCEWLFLLIRYPKHAVARMGSTLGLDLSSVVPCLGDALGMASSTTTLEILQCN